MQVNPYSVILGMQIHYWMTCRRRKFFVDEQYFNELITQIIFMEFPYLQVAMHVEQVLFRQI